MARARHLAQGTVGPVTTLQALPEPWTAPAPPVVQVRRARYEPTPGAAGPPQAGGPRPTTIPTTDLDAGDPDAHRRITAALRLALEVLAGRRPAVQLGALTTPAVLRYWQAARDQRRPRSSARLLKVRLCLPAEGVAEAAAVCAIDGRPRALAARFEQRGVGWQCTAVRLG